MAWLSEMPSTCKALFRGFFNGKSFRCMSLFEIRAKNFRALVDFCFGSFVNFAIHLFRKLLQNKSFAGRNLILQLFLRLPAWWQNYFNRFVNSAFYVSSGISRGKQFIGKYFEACSYFAIWVKSCKLFVVNL